MKTLFLSLLFYLLISFFCFEVLFCAEFTAGNLYLARSNGIYQINDQNPNQNSLFISGSGSDNYRQVTFSYKNGYADHMFITDGTDNDIIKEYDLSGSAFDRWVKQSKTTGSFRENHNRSDEQKELIKLRKENQQLKMENDILKQAALIIGRK